MTSEWHSLIRSVIITGHACWQTDGRTQPVNTVISADDNDDDDDDDDDDDLAGVLQVHGMSCASFAVPATSPTSRL